MAKQRNNLPGEAGAERAEPFAWISYMHWASSCSYNICKNDLASSYKNNALLGIISGRDVGYPQLEEFVQGV